MRLTLLLAASSLATAVALPAMAAQQAAAQSSPTARMPSAEEVSAMFKAADKNSDGKLDAAEFKAMITAFLASRNANFQIPDDAMKRFFDARDTNHDGFISAEENAAPMPTARR